MATIPPHPFYIGECDNDYDVAESLFDPDSMWLVRPQLVFHCTLRPIGTAAGRFNRSDEDIPLELVFFSPFEELRLRTAGIMESKGIHRVYEPSPVPTLYIGRVEDLLGRVPLIPWAPSQWPRLRRSEGSPGPRLPSADGQLSGLANDLCLVYVWYIPGISLVYPWYIPGISCQTVNHAF